MKKEKCDGWTTYNETLVEMQSNLIILYMWKLQFWAYQNKSCMTHYNYMIREYSNIKLLFTDTDCFCYLITTDNDLYKDIKWNTRWDEMCQAQGKLKGIIKFVNDSRGKNISGNEQKFSVQI